MPTLTVGIAVGGGRAGIGRYDSVFGGERVVPTQLSNGLNFERTSVCYDPRYDTWMYGDSAWNRGFDRSSGSFHVRSSVPFLGLDRPMRMNSLAEREHDKSLLPLNAAWLLSRQLRYLADQLVTKNPGEFVIKPVVLAVPLASEATWKPFLNEACSLAGLELLGAVCEPEAILSSYFYEGATTRLKQGERALVFSWGSDTLQLAIVQARSCSPEACELDLLGETSTAGFAGNRVDEFLSRRVGYRLGRDLRLRAGRQFKFVQNLESAKAELSRNSGGLGVFYLDVETVDGSTQVGLGPDDLAAACQERPSVGAQSITDVVVGACERLRGLGGAVDHVYLAGGSARLLVTQPIIQSIFGKHVTFQRVAFSPAQIEEAVLRGTVLRAAELSGRKLPSPAVHIDRSRVVLDDIGILVEADSKSAFLPLVESGRRLPSDRPVSRVVQARNGGNVIINCVRRNRHRPYERLSPRFMHLAYVGLGPVDAGTRIELGIRAVELPRAELTVNWSNGSVGPVPLLV